MKTEAEETVYSYYLLTQAEYELVYLSLFGTDSDADFTNSDADLNTLKSSMIWAQCVNKWPLIAYLISATFCLTCSATCHLCFVHSSYIFDMVAKFDYWGIAVLGLASAYPKNSYKFACSRLLKAQLISSQLKSCSALSPCH